MSELPEGWAETPLESIVDILDSQRIPLNSDERNARIAGKDVSKLVPYYGATGQVGFIDDYIFDEPIVLLGEDGVPFFDLYKHKAYRVSGKSWVNNHAHVIRAKPHVTNNVYIEKYLNYFDYTGVVSGSTRLKLTQGAMREIPVKLAPLPEQKRIADKLDTLLARVDATRERLDRIPQILKQFRQSVLAAATSGRLTDGWREESELESEWIETDIQSVADVGTGSTPLRSNAAFFSPKGTPWITSAATSQSLVMSADKFVTEAAIKSHRLKKFPVGTLLVAMYGEGKTRGQVTELGIVATINQACAAVVVDEKKALKSYVKFALQANYLEMRMLAEGGNQPNLNLSKVKEFPLMLPPINEQKEIVRRVEALFALADKLEVRYQQARAQVEKLTPALLAKAFRGELVEQDPNDEPAERLLERVRSDREEESSMKKKLIKNKG